MAAAERGARRQPGRRRLVHHPRARADRGAALGPPRLRPRQGLALGGLAGRARRGRGRRLPLDAVLRLRRLPPDGHRDPGRPDRRDAAAADPASEAPRDHAWTSCSPTRGSRSRATCGSSSSSRARCPSRNATTSAPRTAGSAPRTTPTTSGPTSTGGCAAYGEPGPIAGHRAAGAARSLRLVRRPARASCSAELGPLTARIERALLTLRRRGPRPRGPLGRRFGAFPPVVLPTPAGHSCSCAARCCRSGSTSCRRCPRLRRRPRSPGWRPRWRHPTRPGRREQRGTDVARTPDGPPPPPAVQRLRLRYAKRGRLRFSSHRDFQRAFERALRRAGVPMAYSAGFSPHPKISYANAAPTGVASEAEYVEIGVAEVLRPGLRCGRRSTTSLPPGLDVLEVVEAATGTSLADRLEASVWRDRLPGVSADAARRRREGLAGGRPRSRSSGSPRTGCAGSTPASRSSRLVVAARACRRTARVRPPARVRYFDWSSGTDTPAVRPDDVLAALRQVADLAPPIPPQVTRLAQGPLDAVAADRRPTHWRPTGPRPPAGTPRTSARPRVGRTPSTSVRCPGSPGAPGGAE